MRMLRSVLGSEVVVAFLVSCAGDAATPQQQPAPTTEPPSPGPTSVEEFPDPVVTEHSGTYWGVYLAAGEGPELEDAIQYLTVIHGLRGNEFNAGSDVNCDQGARKVLGDVGPLVVAVYFASEQDARAWASELPAPPLGIARVRTFCLD